MGIWDVGKNAYFTTYALYTFPSDDTGYCTVNLAGPRTWFVIFVISWLAMDVTAELIITSVNSARMNTYNAFWWL